MSTNVMVFKDTAHLMTQSHPITGLDRLQEVEAPRILDSRHVEVVSQFYAPVALTPQKVSLVLISVRG